VWTPKRVLLLLASFTSIFVVYLVYANFLGGIDGLTPLPEDYWPVAGPQEPLPPPPPIVNLADVKLQQAYGEACPELQRTIKLDLRNRGLVLAVDEFTPQPDGRVLLQPCSLAMFGKNVGPGGFPEINALSAEVAFLTFDKPVKNIAELSSRKILEAELKGNIKIVNNRRTPQRDDDMSLYTQGPLYYKEDLHHIWTQAGVKLIDMQSKPKPTTVTAEGMDIYLTTEAEKPPAPGSLPHKAKAKAERVSDVDHVVLRSLVDMHLFVDADKGGVKPTGPAKSAAPAADKGDKAEIVITTAGPFIYNCRTYLARFDIPQRPSRHPEVVRARRLHEQGKQDMIECDHLELQFRPKTETAGSAPKPAPSKSHGTNENPSEGLAIESAHATGSSLTLTSDAEGLAAFGNDLFYDAASERTVLKGDPEMIALKDGNEIHAQEMWLLGDGKTSPRQAMAKGAGYIGMLDRSAQGQTARTLQARWKDELLYQKQGNLDCLTLVGDAVFEDKEHGQRMGADRLRLWLEPAERTAGQKTGTEQQAHPRPHRIEAQGHVTADSEELHIREPTDTLMVWFKDVPATSAAAAPTKPEAKPASEVAPAPRPAPPSAKDSSPPKQKPADVAAPVASAAPPAKAAAPEKPKTPIDLSANLVKVYVVRCGAKNDLDHLWCEGAVAVHQDPATPEDKGVDIHGDTLDLNHAVDGNILIVNGQWAQVQIDKITILGPEVNIDQRTNRSWVNGIGAMQMLSNTNLDGVKLAKPSELTIHWKEGMHFNGTTAEFRGGIQAEQDNGRLLCQEMQVAFDRPISLKEGNKGGPQPRVDKLLCDKNVQLEDAAHEAGKLVSFKRLVAPVVALDNDEHVITAPGPGEVRILQLGSADEPTAPPGPAGPRRPAPPKPKRTEKQEMKLTHVRFQERMQANNVRRIAIFYGSVEVVHLPADQPDIKIDLENPPQGCVYMSCEKLNVLSHPLPEGGSYQEMEAKDRVVVRAQEFWARADVVKYDTNKGLIIFEGGPNSMANLYRIKRPGEPADVVTGQKIFYWRSTGDVSVEGARGINAVN
jgi:lipopolysaccharide export system protein LptA